MKTQSAPQDSALPKPQVGGGGRVIFPLVKFARYAVIAVVLVFIALCMVPESLAGAMDSLFQEKKGGGRDWEVYYINMETSVERRKRFEESFGPLWGSMRRVPGVDGRDKQAVLEVVGDAELVEGLWKDRNTTELRGELRVTLSHLKAVREAYLRGHEAALIMEDDMCLALRPYWLFDVDDVLATLRRHNVSWHSVQLQYMLHSPNFIGRKNIYKIQEWEMLDGRLYKTWFQWGTGAYLISRAGMEELVTSFMRKSSGGELMLNPLRGSGAVDGSPYYGDKFLENFIGLPALFVANMDQGSVREGGAVAHEQPKTFLKRIRDVTRYATWRYEQASNQTGLTV